MHFPNKNYKEKSFLSFLSFSPNINVVQRVMIRFLIDTYYKCLVMHGMVHVYDAVYV